ncbi:MAG: serine kinase [Culturomica sp.]|jgi:serine kinase of HPr protein (carbohydrate metabolism regulator)|nr:serine kinase [Culturomica sp.]
MNVAELAEKLRLEVCCGASGLDREIKGGYTSDLLSDVMGNAEEGQVWVTLQTHKNILAIASLKELAAIVLVKGYQPEEEAREESLSEGIPILLTGKPAFEITGEIYELLKNKPSASPL